MMLRTSVYLALCIFLPRVTHGGKVLVFPVDGSHWVNMKILIEELHSRGHEVTVVRSNDSWYITENSPLYNSLTLDLPSGFDEHFISDFVAQLLEIQQQGQSAWMRFNLEIQQTIKATEIHRKCSRMVQGLLEDDIKMKFINDSKFDLILTDPVIPTGVIVAHYLALPLVYNVRWASMGEAHLSFAPSPLSYVPMTGTTFSDKMSFSERVVNVLLYALACVQMSYFVAAPYQGVIEKYLGPDKDYFSMFLAADIWLMRVDFVFEFPRPTMPNVVYMGGFQCKPAEPLPRHLEEFVQSSGEHGVVIMSLGTLIGSLPHELSEEIAAGFAKLPQKVIWRYTGEKPSTLGNNTLLVEWMPQNDLLGHPKTRVFVAHGGTNGVQEAIYHGVPILGLPLVFDQPDNLFRIDERRAGKIIDIFTMNRNTFYESLQDVLHEASYRNNMQRLSRLHRDQWTRPLDSAIFWIEFVMRHRGAAHLRTQSYKTPWFSYCSLDVILFLAAVCFLTFVCALAIFRSLYIKCCTGVKRKIN